MIVDSSASDTVMPPKKCAVAAEIRHSSNVGTEHEVADGDIAKNLNDELCEMKINGPTWLA